MKKTVESKIVVNEIEKLGNDVRKMFLSAVDGGDLPKGIDQLCYNMLGAIKEDDFDAYDFQTFLYGAMHGLVIAYAKLKEITE